MDPSKEVPPAEANSLPEHLEPNGDKKPLGPSGMLPTEGNQVPASVDHSPSPLREEQLQNAVAFLSHPKVLPSPLASKRTFLERKGLTSAEIDEALRRVSEYHGAVSGMPVVSTSAQPTQLETGGQLSPVPYKPYQQGGSNSIVTPQTALAATPSSSVPQGYRWSQVVLGGAMLATALYAVQSLLYPYAKSWYDKYVASVVMRQKQIEEQTAENARAIAKAMDGQTAELRAAVESLREIAQSLQSVEPAKQSLASSIKAELQSQSATLCESLKHSVIAAVRSSAQSSQHAALQSVQQTLFELKETLAASSLPPSNPMVSSSLRPANGFNAGAVRDGHVLNLAAASDARPLGSERTPVSTSMEAQTCAYRANTQVAERLLPPFTSVSTNYRPQNGPTPENPQHPSSYSDFLGMIQRGETPPNVRTDIEDIPPDPSVPLSEAKLRPRPKPWETGRSSASRAGSMLDNTSQNSGSRPESRDSLRVLDGLATKVTALSNLEDVQEVKSVPEVRSGLLEVPSTDGLGSTTHVNAVDDGQMGGNPKAMATEGRSSSLPLLSPGNLAKASNGWNPPPLPTPSIPVTVDSGGSSTVS